MIRTLISDNPSSKTREECETGIPLDGGLVLVGVAVSWENRDAYYIALTHENPQGKAKIDLHQLVSTIPTIQSCMLYE